MILKRLAQIERHIAHQFELCFVRACVDPLKDLGTGWRLGIEVALDDGVELFEGLERGQVKIGEAIRRKDDLAVRVHFDDVHGRSPFPMRCCGLRIDEGRDDRDHMSRPPLTPQTCPVMYPEAAYDWKCTTRAISHGWANLRIGMLPLIRSRTFSGIVSIISVAT